jgi:hypothetical protein
MASPRNFTMLSRSITLTQNHSIHENSFWLANNVYLDSNNCVLPLSFPAMLNLAVSLTGPMSLPSFDSDITTSTDLEILLEAL